MLLGRWAVVRVIDGGSLETRKGVLRYGRHFGGRGFTATVGLMRVIDIQELGNWIWFAGLLG
jgi:hypothetical protein